MCENPQKLLQNSTIFCKKQIVFTIYDKHLPMILRFYATTFL